MALQIEYKKEIIAGHEILFNEAYAGITYLSGDKDNFDIFVTIYSDNTKQSVLENTSYRFRLDITDNGLNPYKQGYNYLKTLDKYVNAIDVLEDGQVA